MSKEPVIYRFMTEDELDIASSFKSVNFGSGSSFNKRLAESLYYQSQGNKLISNSQSIWMFRILYVYRRQLPGLYQRHQNNPNCRSLKNYSK